MSDSVIHTINTASSNNSIRQHVFKDGPCKIELNDIQEDDTSATIESFSCMSIGSGLGRKLLLYVLKWIKDKYPSVNVIQLTAVPIVKYDKSNNYDTKISKQNAALIKLKQYYTKLGFIENYQSKDDFEGDINDIIEIITTYIQRAGFTYKYKYKKNKKLSKRVKSSLYKTKRKSY